MSLAVLAHDKKANRSISQRYLIKSTLYVCVFFAVTYGSGAAYSEMRNPSDAFLTSINTRTNPAFDPQGIRMGDMIVSPSISTGWKYTDNVYAVDTGEVADMIFTVRPSLNLRSDFVRHSIAASFSGERGLYRKTTSENYTDYRAALSGEIDVTGNTIVPLSLSYEHDHIRRDADDDLRTAEPAEFDLWTGSTGLIHRGRSFAAKVMATVRDFAFDTRNQERDRSEYSLYSSVGFPEQGYFAPFVYNELTSIRYDNKSAGGFSRDSNGYEIGVGSIVNFSTVTKGSFNVGYISRNAEDARFSDIGDFSYGLNLVWEPSTLAAFTLEGKRSTDETLTTGTQGSIKSTIGLSMNYEMFPNLFLKPGIGYQLREYEGIDKELERVTSGIEATYKMNQNLWLSAGYQYITQDEQGSRPDPDDFKSNAFNLSLKLQF